MADEMVWRVVGWDPYRPGTARWLSAAGTPTEDLARARVFVDAKAAEVAGCAATANAAGGLARWAPTRATRLEDVQSQVWRPRAGVSDGPPDGW